MGEELEKDRRKVKVQLYINGEGPKYEFLTELKGWQPNQLDIRDIMLKYDLQSVHAFSVINGRGLEITPNPRNGLSLTTYNPKPETIIRLDGVPKDSDIFSKLYVQFGTVGICVLVVFITVEMRNEQVRDRLLKLKPGPEWFLLTVLALLILLNVWLYWKKSLARVFQKRLD